MTPFPSHPATNQGTAVGTTAPGQTPVSWGFEKSYALLGGGGGDHFGRNGSTAYVEDDHYVSPTCAPTRAG